MKIELKSVDPNVIRYSTCGDWEWLPGDHLKVTVPDYGSQEDSAFLVALHEMVEAWLCKKAGILESDVSKWDIDHPELEEPGDHEDAPYHEQHKVATEIEKMVAAAMKKNWDGHNKWVGNAADEVDRTHNDIPKTPQILAKGARFWAELHLYGLRHTGKNSSGWFNDWVSAIPFDDCPCKKHLKEYLEENPPEWNRFFDWGVELHNAVNFRIGRPTVDIENAKELWENRLF
jgi:hypothetical protein